MRGRNNKGEWKEEEEGATEMEVRLQAVRGEKGTSVMQLQTRD
jgi:hypothetical protein